MGCTSSTANMPESQSSTTDNTENNMTGERGSEETIKGNDIIYRKIRELEENQVLPESEITNNQMKVASDANIKVTGDMFNVGNKDIQEDNPSQENHGDKVIESSPLKDNIVSLKVVVEKVISENTKDGENITPSNLIESRTLDLDRQIEEIISESNDSEGAEVELVEDEAKESSSPTQSEDSRATRWEALADIAAELPPSLAVDPLTGQIYSLTK